jgi:hypothetical protein
MVETVRRSARGRFLELREFHDSISSLDKNRKYAMIIGDDGLDQEARAVVAWARERRSGAAGCRAAQTEMQPKIEPEIFFIFSL